MKPGGLPALIGAAAPLADPRRSGFELLLLEARLLAGAARPPPELRRVAAAGCAREPTRQPQKSSSSSESVDSTPHSSRQRATTWRSGTGGWLPGASGKARGGDVAAAAANVEATHCERSSRAARRLAAALPSREIKRGAAAGELEGSAADVAAAAVVHSGCGLSRGVDASDRGLRCSILRRRRRLERAARPLSPTAVARTPPRQLRRCHVTASGLCKLVS